MITLNIFRERSRMPMQRLRSRQTTKVIVFFGTGNGMDIISYPPHEIKRESQVQLQMSVHHLQVTQSVRERPGLGEVFQLYEEQDNPEVFFFSRCETCEVALVSELRSLIISCDSFELFPWLCSSKSSGSMVNANESDGALFQ